MEQWNAAAKVCRTRLTAESPALSAGVYRSAINEQCWQPHEKRTRLADGRFAPRGQLNCRPFAVGKEPRATLKSPRYQFSIQDRPTRMTQSALPGDPRRRQFSIPRHPLRSVFKTPAPHRSGPFNPQEPHNDWEIALSGDLTDKQHDLLEKLIDAPRKSRGTIFFDTGGGSAYVGLALASIIRLRGLRVTGIVAGECSSAAILPFAACERRFVTPHSTLLFHPVRWASEEDIRFEEAAEWARHFKIFENDLDELISKLMNFPIDKLTEWTRPGRFVTGPEMVEAGLAQMVNLFDGDVYSQIAAKS